MITMQLYAVVRHLGGTGAGRRTIVHMGGAGAVLLTIAGDEVLGLNFCLLMLLLRGREVPCESLCICM